MWQKRERKSSDVIFLFTQMSPFLWILQGNVNGWSPITTSHVDNQHLTTWQSILTIWELCFFTADMFVMYKSNIPFNRLLAMQLVNDVFQNFVILHTHILNNKEDKIRRSNA
jgi:hypothetical protein